MLDSISWDRLEVDRLDIEGVELFPMPLTAMERFFVWDHHAQYPKRFQIIVDCDGSLDKASWFEALRTTVQRHAMLLADVIERKLHWIISDKPFLEVAFLYDERLASMDESRRISQIAAAIGCESNSSNSVTGLTPNLRVAALCSADRVTLAFDVYHPACDGLGMRLFIEEATACYNELMKQNASGKRWRQLDPNLLQQRGELPTPKAKDATRKTTLWEKLSHAFHFHCLGPYPIQSKRFDQATNDARGRHEKPSLEFRAAEIDMEQLQGLKMHLIDRDISMNDWAIACLLLTLYQWQRRNNLAKRTRISLPVDLRTWNDLRTPACNKIGFGFVVATPELAADRQALVHHVKHQVEMIRSLCLGADFVRLLEPLQRVKGLVRFFLNSNSCFATAVLTNLGDVTARQRKGRDNDAGRSTAGDLKLKAIYGWPPIRKNTQMGIGLCRFDHRLSVAGVFDSSVLSSFEVDELFACYLRNLQNYSS